MYHFDARRAGVGTTKPIVHTPERASRPFFVERDLGLPQGSWIQAGLSGAASVACREAPRAQQQERGTEQPRAEARMHRDLRDVARLVGAGDRQVVERGIAPVEQVDLLIANWRR